MTDIAGYKKIISDTFSNELRIDNFALLGKGKSSLIFIANDEIVFKVPLQNEGDIARWQQNEAVVLRFLEGKLPGASLVDIEIPRILYTATSKCGAYIIGETFLSGTTLSYELYDTFDEKIKNDILRQLGRIVRSLHEAGGNDPSWLRCDHQETLDDIMEEFYERFSDKVRIVFSCNEIEKIERIAEHYKEVSLLYPVKPVLCHNDLHFYNLMFDTESKQIIGMLDFGCAGYDEPARDWHYYFDSKYVLEGYGDNGDEFFLVRQRFHALSWKLCTLNDELTNEQKLSESLGYIRKYILEMEEKLNS
ncbi:MAG: phosphotransferase [Oscillospiraceae bacterium]|jgi:aminoglycoside 2''-phosphotransferase|nr:phosphotransferase [Oscillospiraceae bacterium]